MGELKLISPATGEVRGTLQEVSVADVQAAMERARAAFSGWSQLTVAQRAAYMRKLRIYIADHAEELARDISFDTGKVFMDALTADVLTVVEFIAYYEKNAERFLSVKQRKTHPMFFGKKTYIRYRPQGVVAVIAPWNYPFQLSIVPIISALFAGNTVLLKPSEVSPLTGLLIERAFQAVGFPEGVVQVLHGGGDVGQSLVAAKPDKIFFTGSVATGKKVAAAAAEHLIPVELELGGKDPMLVLADAPLERAANAAVWGGIMNSGQVCMSVERIYVHESVYEQFVGLVTDKVKQIRQGTGVSDDVGSMTYPAQLAIIHDQLQDAVEKGAQVLTGGSVDPQSMFIPPTVLVNVDHRMKVMTEETFGPLLPIMKVQSEAEAVQLANDSRYGLNGSVWSKDLGRARRVAAQLVTGNVCINDVIITVANPDLPYGGVKDSGLGRYHGPEGLYSFCHQTSVLENRVQLMSEITWYPYTEDKISVVKWVLNLRSSNRRLLDGKALLSAARVFLGKNKPAGNGAKNPADRKNLNA